ncbi:MAG TPA: response regulator [Allosphingosinicella sp.]|jgi:DNA-binding NtrC family response regulator
MERLGPILVLDDDRDVLQAAEFTLAGHAARVVTARSPDAIDAALAGATYDCVLLDMNFAAGQRSGGEGFEALAAIKSADPTLSVVLMTAYGAVALAVESLKRGADDFLLKPWRNDALVAAVTAAAARTRTARTPLPLDEVERRAVAQALERHGGNIAQAALALGLSRPALYRKIGKHGL